MNTRLKKTDTAVPQNISEANAMLGVLGQKEKTLQEITNQQSEKIAEIQKSFEEKIKAATAARDVAFEKVYTFAQPRRLTLIQKVKTLFWSCGTIGWRFTPPAVNSVFENDSDIIRVLKQKGFDNYVRKTEEVDREKLLKDRPIIAGISYVSREEFFAKPKFTLFDKKKSKTITKVIS